MVVNLLEVSHRLEKRSFHYISGVQTLLTYCVMLKAQF